MTGMLQNFQFFGRTTNSYLRVLTIPVSGLVVSTAIHFVRIFLSSYLSRICEQAALTRTTVSEIDWP